MDVELNSEFNLTKENCSVDFKLSYNFSFITIEKIVLKSHMRCDASVWSNILSCAALKVTQSMNSGKTLSDSYNLLQFVSVHHKFPMLETHLEVPSKNDRKYSSISDFTTRIEIKLELKGIEETVDFLFLYKTTPGANLVDKNEV